jgi:hypothetical protein
MIAFGALQSYAGVGNGFAVGVQHLATHRADPCGQRGGSKAAGG